MDLGGGAAGDAEELAARGGAGDQGDARFGQAEGVGEEGDESFVGTAIDRWSGEGDLEGVGMSARHRVAAGSGVDADGEGAAVRGWVETGGKGGFGLG